MILAMLCIPSVDGLAKHLSGSYSPLFLGWARYCVATFVVLPYALISHGKRLFPSERLLSHVLRTVFLVSAMTLYLLAVARVPLATAASSFLVGPVVAVALAVAVLGERLSYEKCVSLALGVAGSLVILRPGASMEPGVLLALGAGVLFGLYLVATAHASLMSSPVQTLVYQCVLGTALLTPQAAATWRVPPLSDLPLFVALGALSALSHALSILAFRYASASTLAPLVYVELVGAALVGYLAFNEIPDTYTLAGAACIVMAGFVALFDRPIAPRIDEPRDIKALR